MFKQANREMKVKEIEVNQPYYLDYFGTGVTTGSYFLKQDESLLEWTEAQTLKSDNSEIGVEDIELGTIWLLRKEDYQAFSTWVCEKVKRLDLAGIGWDESSVLETYQTPFELLTLEEITYWVTMLSYLWDSEVEWVLADLKRLNLPKIIGDK